MSLYLGVAPVYWLPGMSPDLLRSMKIGLFILAVGFVFLHGQTVRGVVPRGLWGPVGFIALIFFSVPGLVQAVDLSSRVEFVMDVGFGAVFLWCFFNAQWRGDIDAGVVLGRSLAVISIFIACTIVNSLTGLPSWQSPYGHTLTEGGFGSMRTGWSNGLALFLPSVLFLLGDRPLRKSVIRHLSCLVILICLVASQFLAGGRAGMLLSILTIVVLTCLRPQFAILTFSALLLAAVLALPENWYMHMRLDRLEVGVKSLEDLDHFSAQRIGGYLMAVDLLKERPWIGYGIGQVIYETSNARHTEIHNLWLKWMVYCGVLAPLFFLIMVIRLLGIAFQQLRLAARWGDARSVAALVLTLLLGILLTMAEPNPLVGTFQTSAVWWAVAGTVLGLCVRRVEQMGSVSNSRSELVSHREVSACSGGNWESDR